MIQAVKAGFRGIDTACQPKACRHDFHGGPDADPSTALQVRRAAHHSTDGLTTAISKGGPSGRCSSPPLLIRDRFPRRHVHPDEVRQTFIVSSLLPADWIQRFTSVDGQDTSQPLPYDHHLPIPQQVEQSFARSLSNLGLDYIDSVVLHSPLSTRDVSPLWTVRVLWLISDKANASRLSDAGRLRQSGEGAAPRRIQHIRFGDVELDHGGGESEGRGCTEQVHRSHVIQCGKRRLMGGGR